MQENLSTEDIFRQLWTGRSKREALNSLYLYEQGLGDYPGAPEIENLVSFCLAIKKRSRLSLTPLGSSLAYNLLEYAGQVKKRKIDKILQELNIGPESIVADIGCGGGQTLFAIQKYAPKKVFGVDRDQNAIHFARFLFSQEGIPADRYNFLEAGIEEYLLPEGFFTHLICRSVLQKLRVAKNLARFDYSLIPGGRVYLMVMTGRYYFSRLGIVLRRPIWLCYFIFVFLNGFLFEATGFQFTIRLGRRRLSELFFTETSLRRALRRNNFKIETFSLRPPQKRSATAFEVVARKKNLEV